MRHFSLFSVILAFSLISFSLAGVTAMAAEPITLRVALYPYVPNQYALFALLAREFQHKNEGVTLELVKVDPSKDYYDDGLLTLDADVYEIDSILLSEMVAANGGKKIAPLSIALSGFTPEAVEAVTRDGTVYAIPHWLCGNFLFYRKNETAIRDATTWSDLIGELQKQKKSIMFDFFGHLTLGEWYITLLADRVGIDQAQTEILRNANPDPTVVSDLAAILSACPSGFCRSKSMHDKTGFYARAFVRGESSGYIAYSETLYSGLQEILNNCEVGSFCVSPDEIAVRRLPSIARDAAPGGIGWVDGLAISATLTGSKKDAALKFIEFATSADGYKAVLQPQWMEAPRYLIPARTGLRLPDSPLYPAIYAAHAGRRTGTLIGLNPHLRTLSEKLNCLLPIDRTDMKSAASCKH